MRVVGVKRALRSVASLVSGPALLFFSNSDQLLTDVGPVELWTAHWRRPSAAANPQGCWPRTPSVARERVFRSRLRHYNDGIVPLRCDPWLEPILSTAALMPAEPHIRSPLPERLAPQSLILEVIG